MMCECLSHSLSRAGRVVAKGPPVVQLSSRLMVDLVHALQGTKARDSRSCSQKAGQLQLSPLQKFPS